MDVSFVTPLAGLFASAALVPLTAFVTRRRRLREIRAALALEQPTLRSQAPLVAALVAVPVLLGVAAAQPVIETTRTVRERTDAQVFVVVDVSRSMLAAARPGARTRFERARAIALGLRDELPEVPLGVATLTDQVLPHLFPTTDPQVYDATLTRAIGIEQPPPGAFYLTVATDLNALGAVPEKNYFLPTATKRALVVVTDGETQPLEPDLARPFRRRPRIDTVFVHIWNADERIYETGVAEGGYRPDGRSREWLARAASLVGGRVFEEEDAPAAAEAVRGALGDGPTVDREQGSRRLALMPYCTLAALVPLCFCLLRRNLWWTWSRRSLRRKAPVPRIGRLRGAETSGQ